MLSPFTFILDVNKALGRGVGYEISLKMSPLLSKCYVVRIVLVLVRREIVEREAG